LDIGTYPGQDPFYLAGIVFKTVPIIFGLTGSNLVDAAVAFTTSALAGTAILGLR
jgi:hypothetical protein